MKHPQPGIDYDPSSADDIVYYALNLQGSTLRKELEIPKDVKFERKGKGGFGESVEYYYFGYEPNSKQAPDFEEVGIELKVTPLKVIRGDKEVPKERLVITMINYMTVVEERFETSSLYQKINKVLLMHYLHDDETDPFDYQFRLVHLWSVPAEDYPTIKEDWEFIVNKIRDGLAHELSGGDTNYLEATTKAADSSVTREQPFSTIPAKPRAFALKSSYMRMVVDKAKDMQSITRDEDQTELGLDQLVKSSTKQYIGMIDKDLCKLLGVDYDPSNKSLWVNLTYRMLGITNNRSSEFMKANITVRSIRKELNGRIVESLSLTPFEFKDLASESWDDSELNSYLSETRFLFAVYKSHGNYYKFAGCSFWNMPTTLLDKTVRAGWEEIQGTVVSGVQFTKTVLNSGKFFYKNNLPKKSDNPVIHIRPHAQRAAYLFADGTEIGNVQRDASELPDGQWMTKQSFWLNNEFIAWQVPLLNDL
ncbi:MAG: restriction endonuclease [Coriobacteriia bacterium]|nr:restriction endonuclease [Coriobacteriia bacterium]MCL2750179.1 restriction endonuclease [Coriobacteriia bacterium]